MPLVSRTIPNLVQGVSQQPEVLRLSSQATSQLNRFSSVDHGIKKRPPTKYIPKLSTESKIILVIGSNNSITSISFPKKWILKALSA